jgi:hypothetical protein
VREAETWLDGHGTSWESATATDSEVTKKEVELIRQLRANDPAIGYNRWPPFGDDWFGGVVYLRRCRRAKPSRPSRARVANNAVDGSGTTRSSPAAKDLSSSKMNSLTSIETLVG